MTRDDFLDGLRDDWRRTPVDLSRISAATMRRRIWSALVNLVSLTGTAGALLLGLWFAWFAFAERDPIAAVGAVALFVSAPVLWLEYLEGRRTRSMRYDDTPQGVLLQARQQIAFARGLQRGCRWCAFILGGGALALVAIGLADPDSARRAFATAATWGGTAGAVWLWYLWRRRRNERELAACEALLGDLGAEEAPDRA